MTLKKNMGIQKKPLANPEIVLREEFDNWAFLYNPDTAEVIIINPTGVAVWKSMDGKNNRDDILAQVRKSFSEVPEEVNEHVNAFIKDLEERGLVGYELV
jgi:SynChlorMet cassette protein ScmD